MLQRLRMSRVLLDGEVVAFDEKGRPDFDRLAPRLGQRHGSGPLPPVSYLVFDVLAVGAADVRGVALIKRKQLVELVVARSKGNLRAVPFVLDDGRQLAAFIDAHDLEGLVAKRADSPYRAGPSTDWLKAKRRHEEEFTVVRYRCDRDGKIEALALALRRDGKLVAQGVVEVGAWRVKELLPAAKRAGWAVAPASVVVTCTFTGRTSAGRLREAVVKGLRAECT